MFLGAAIDPDYFHSKVNLYVALAPIAAINPGTTEDEHPYTNGPNWQEFELMAQKIGLYEMFNANWLEESAV